MNQNTPALPAGIARAHAERRVRQDRELAQSFAGQSTVGPEVIYPSNPPATRKTTERVRTLVTTTPSGARLETYVGREPRTDVEVPQPGRGRAETARDRLRAANERHNRRGRHLLGPLDG